MDRSDGRQDGRGPRRGEQNCRTLDEWWPPSGDQTCQWLALDPTMDEVATRLSHLRLLRRDLDESIRLLRQHAFLRLGEGCEPDPEPF